jgi:hypothetical protein
MRAKRVDQNHTRICNALRAIGCLVFDTSSVGRGFPDIAICYGGRCFLIEIKDGSKARSARQLTGPQREFWRGWAECCFLIESEQDVIDLKNKLDFDLKEWK